MDHDVAERLAHSSSQGKLGPDKTELDVVDTPLPDKKAYPDLEIPSQSDGTSLLEDATLVNGEPVIHDGKDVSAFIVDIRDDGDPALTFRSLFLGTVFAGLTSALFQIYLFKPVQIPVSTVFILLIVYTIGNAWALFLPRRSWVEGRPALAWIATVFHFINPGEFGLKEHAVATLIASTAAHGSSAVTNFAVQRLFYDTKVDSATAVLATFSTACFGYGLVGLFRPLTIYPSEMVFWMNLPTVSLFQAMHFGTGANRKRLRIFWTAFTGMFCYEIIPAYMFPTLNAFNIFCLASRHARPSVQNVFTNLFGGGDANEGLGFLSLSFDWQYITSVYVSVPLIQQANTWFGFAIGYVVFMAIYYSDAWNSQSFPFLSTSLFAQNGTVYDQTYVFPNDILNTTRLSEIGLPALTGSNAWANLSANLSIGALIMHVALFWGPSIKKSFVQARRKTQPDPHWKAMQKYNEVPWYWFAGLLLLAFFAGLLVVLKGNTTLPWWSYIVALLLGALIAPFSTILFARMGAGVETIQVMKMVAGAINPGRPVANLYFSMWSHDVIGTSIYLAQDLKMGQYLKIPPRVMFLTQIWATIVGAIVNYFVMVAVVDAQRDILLRPIGTNVWSGAYLQGTNSAAVTWSLAKDLYSPSGPYFWVPVSLLFGGIVTTLHWFIHRRWKTIGPLRVDSIILPLVWMYVGYNSSGITSIVLSSAIVGIISQIWLRRSHPGWFIKYNYILGGAFDGGSQVMIFILSFAVFGASGKSRPFPPWAGNPGRGNVDYCNGNSALD